MTDTTQAASELTAVLTKLDIRSVAGIVLTVVIGLIAIKYVLKLIKKILSRTSLNDTLKSIVITAVKFSLYFVLITTVADMLGLPPASLITVAGTLGIAFSLAMQDSLANIAGGILIMYTSPFKTGDYIEACGVEGTVDKVGLVHTALNTVDNKKIFVPNGTLSKDKIINYSAEDHRRLELIFQIGYGCDTKKAKSIIEETVSSCGYVCKDRELFIRVWSLGASSVDIIVRCWVGKGDYIEAKCELLESVKCAFDEKGITIPYNQLDVNISGGQ